MALSTDPGELVECRAPDEWHGRAPDREDVAERQPSSDDVQLCVIRKNVDQVSPPTERWRRIGTENIP
jgi:hypothetical protein